MPIACRARSWRPPSRFSNGSGPAWGSRPPPPPFSNRAARAGDRPLPSRVGPDPPRLVAGDPPLQAAYEEAARLAADDGLFAVVGPASPRGGGGALLFLA